MPGAASRTLATGRIVTGTPLPWLPSRIPSLALWLDASDLSTLFQDSAFTTPVAANSDPVGGWKDKSGNAYNAVQATAGNRPLYKTGIQNGLSVLRTDRTLQQWIACSNISVLQPGTSFIVVIPRGSFSGNDVICAGVSSYFLFAVSGSSNWACYSGGSIVSSTPAVLATAAVLSAKFNGVSSVLRLNGTQIGAGNVATGNLAAPYRIGSEASGNFWNGDIAEHLIWYRLLTAAELAQVDGYLNQKWRVY